MNDNEYVVKLIETLRGRVSALTLANIELEAALLVSQAENQRTVATESDTSIPKPG